MFGLFKSKAKEPSVSKSTTISESSVSASLPPKPSETNYEAEAASNRIAAEQGNAEAQYKLGLMYASGRGVKQDRAEMLKWFRASAAGGNVMAQKSLGMLSGAESPAESVTSLVLRAERGEANAQFELGRAYETGGVVDGKKVVKNEAEAVKWYRAAAEQGDLEAQFNLAIRYEDGQGVAKDEAEAVKWYRAAAEQGDDSAQYNLGVMYAQGRGVAKNEAEAVKWFRAVAEQGYAEAQFNLGVRYANGRGVAKNEAEAVKWYRAAAEQGRGNAQFALGLCYQKGEGVLQSDAHAVYWYRKAIKNGSKEAVVSLNQITLTPALEKQVLEIERGAGVSSPQAQPPKVADKKPSVPAKPAQVSPQARLSLSISTPTKTSPVRPVSSHTVNYVPGLYTRPATPQTPPVKASSSPALNEAGQITVSRAIETKDISLIKKLAAGGFGTVHLGKWRRQHVAVKELHLKHLDEQALNEFKKEASVMMQLQSPWVVRLFGVTLESPYYLVMEYMQGGSLYQLLRSGVDLPWSRRVSIALDVAEGLSFLHSKNIIHRDMKSMNVLLDEGGHAKLGDFGLALIKSESASQSSAGHVGTVAWMAPELFERKAKYTPASDVYGLGMVLWEIASRKIPFSDAANQSLITVWVMRGDREEIPLDTPSWYEDLIKSAWQANPQTRPTVVSLADQLVEGNATYTTDTDNNDDETSSVGNVSSYGLMGASLSKSRGSTGASPISSSSLSGGSSSSSSSSNYSSGLMPASHRGSLVSRGHYLGASQDRGDSSRSSSGSSYASGPTLGSFK